MWHQLSNYAMKLHMQQQPFPKIMIGFDFGVRNTGISITSSDMKHAFYLTSIKHDIRSLQFKQQITNLLRKQKPNALVIGKPNYVVESQQKENIIELIDTFIKEIPSEHPKIADYRFTYMDESWTTQESKAQVKAIENEIRRWGHLRNQKDLIDGMAAINILRRYLQYFNKN